MESPPRPALSIVARKPPAGGPSRRRWILPAALAAILLLSGAAYLRLRPRKPPPQPVAKLAPSLTTPSGEMVLVPAGTFLSGEAKEPLWLPAFYIDKIEVTNAAYAAFCRAAPHDLPPDFPRGMADYPVVNVSMADARAFAAWAGKRIPSGREWEKAARGESGQTFPWGEEPDRSRANIGLISLLPSNAFPKGASPYGALQMIGNAWELVNDEHSPDERTLAIFSARMDPPLAADEPWYAIRGGAYDNPQLTARLLWDSTSVPARWRSPNIGFRCVQDAK